MISFNYCSHFHKFIMKHKLTTAWATVYAATVAGITTVYTHSEKLKGNKDLALMNHNLEIERMKNQMESTSMNSVKIVKETLNGSVPSSTQTSSTDIVENKLKDLIVGDSNTYNKAGFDLDTLSDSSLEFSTLQLVSITLFLYDIAILICLIGIIVNYYIRLYGNEYKEKLPKWSLPIIRYYLKLAEYTNYTYVLSIVMSLILSMLFCLIFLFM
nr:hypothetical protein [Apophysomyces elegans]